MGIGSIGIPGLILILIIALIIFGPGKLPQIGKAVGQTLSEFKKSTKEVVDEVIEPAKEAKETVVELVSTNKEK